MNLFRINGKQNENYVYPKEGQQEGFFALALAYTIERQIVYDQNFYGEQGW